MDDAAIEALRSIVSLLVRGEYDQIERVTAGDRLPADELRFAVERYGRRLVDPPEDAWSDLDAVLVAGSNPPTHHVAFDLWAEGEGRTDLTLEASVSRLPDGTVRVQVLDLHTL